MRDRGRGILSEAERMRIRAAREAKGFSMQELSLRLGYSRGVVEKLEHGGGIPGLQLMFALYRALDLDYINVD